MPEANDIFAMFFWFLATSFFTPATFVILAALLLVLGLPNLLLVLVLLRLGLNGSRSACICGHGWIHNVFALLPIRTLFFLPKAVAASFAAEALINDERHRYIVPTAWVLAWPPPLFAVLVIQMRMSPGQHDVIISFTTALIITRRVSISLLSLLHPNHLHGAPVFIIPAIAFIPAIFIPNREIVQERAFVASSTPPSRPEPKFAKVTVAI